MSPIEPEQRQSPHSSLREEENSICRRCRDPLCTSIGGHTDFSVNLAPVANRIWTPSCVTRRSTLQRKRCSTHPLAHLPTQPWPKDATYLLLAAGEVKSLHSGTESHGGFSPAAVQIRDDLSQALCEASWCGSAEEGAGRRRGACEVTLLQNTNATQSNGRARTQVMQPV